jgi:CDP-diacylglycerol--glycerol-3-phosphate 3-phosphatidyltransferase
MSGLGAFPIKGLGTSLGPILVLFTLWIIGIPIFAYQYNRRGRPRNERLTKVQGSFLLSHWLMEYGYWVMAAPARFFIRLGVGPDALTLMGLVIVSGASVAVGFGSFGLGGWLILFGSMLDAIDGIVARETGKSSDAGEFLDAIVDRYCEIASYIGLCYYYNESPWAMGIVLGALLGSMMVSYSRAKAESLGVHDAPSGLMRRHERALYLGLGIALAPVVAYFTEPSVGHPIYHLTLIACGAVGLLSNLSALQMSAYVKRKLREAKSGAVPNVMP